MFKQLHYFKSWLLLMLCMVVGVGSAMADTQSVDITPSQALNDGGVDPITIVCAKGDGTSNPAISSSQLRLYQAASGKTTGNTITFSSDKTITSIVFTFANDMTASNGSFSEGTYDSSTSTWTGSTNSVTLTVTGTTSGTRIYISALTVYYEGGVSAPLESITLSGADIDNVPAFYVNGEFTHNVTVTANYADNTTKDVTSSASFTAPDMTTAGEGKTVTVSYTEGEDEQAITKTAEYTINVYEITTETVKFNVNGELTSEEVAVGAAVPFPTVADIDDKVFVGWSINAIDGTTDIAPADLMNSATMPNESVTYYAVFATKTTGTDEVLNQTLSYDSWTYSGSTTDKSSYRLFHTDSYVESAPFDLSTLTTVKIYGGTFGGQTTYNTVTIGDGINVWKEVIMTGTGNNKEHPFTDGTALSGTKSLRIISTCGTATGSGSGIRISKIEIFTESVSYSAYCTTVVADTRAEAGISFANENVEAEYAVPYYGESLTNPNNVTPITWTSTNETVATVSNAGAVTVLAVGETTIKATFVGNDTYKPAEVSYTLNVVDSRTALTMAFDPASVSATVNETTITAPTLTIKDENDEDVTGLTIGYISDNTEVATVDDYGVVTLTGVAGNTRITAQFAGNNQYLAAFADYTITVTDPSAPESITKWVEVDPNDLTTGDVVVIVDKTSSKAMINSTGSSTAPTATEVTLNTAQNEITSTVGETLQWTVTVSGTDVKSYQFGVDDDFLYVTKTNNGVRIGSSARNTFTIVTGGDNDGYYLFNTEEDDNRYIGCYNQQDWRCYGSINNNIKGNNNAFYKKVEVYVLDDTSNGNAAKIAAINGQTVNVKVERTLSPSYYNTLFLPFAMTADQVKAAFGENVQVATFTSMLSETTFGFANVSAMAANTGYLVKPEAAVNGFTVEGVTITNAASSTATADDDWMMFGTYDTFNNSATNEVYYFTTSGTVKKLAATGSIKGLRAFMCKKATAEVIAIDSNVDLSFGGGGDGTGDSTPQARVDFTLSLEDDTTTGINTIENAGVDATAPAYNLAGQKVGKGYKGIVIQNGKKVVIK